MSDEELLRQDPDLAKMFESESEEEDDDDDDDVGFGGRGRGGSKRLAKDQANSAFKRSQSMRVSSTTSAASSGTSAPSPLARQGSGRGFKRGASAFRLAFTSNSSYAF